MNDYSTNLLCMNIPPAYVGLTTFYFVQHPNFLVINLQIEASDVYCLKHDCLTCLQTFLQSATSTLKHFRLFTSFPAADILLERSDYSPFIPYCHLITSLWVINIYISKLNKEEKFHIVFINFNQNIYLRFFIKWVRKMLMIALVHRLTLKTYNFSCYSRK